MLDNLPIRMVFQFVTILFFVINVTTCNPVKRDDEEKALLLLQRSIIRARLSVNRALIQKRQLLHKRFIDGEDDTVLRPTQPVMINFLHRTVRAMHGKLPSTIDVKGKKFIGKNTTITHGRRDNLNRKNKTSDVRQNLPSEFPIGQYHELPVPVSNPNPFMHIKTHSTSPEFGTNVFKGPTGLASSHGVDSLTPEEAINGAAKLAGSNEIIEGCYDPCHPNVHDQLLHQVTNHNSPHLQSTVQEGSQLLQQASALKADSKIKAIQAKQLEEQAKAIKKPGVTGHNPHLENDYLNVDKPVHIMSGHLGKGPERGGSSDFEHNAINYKVQVGGDRVSLNPPGKGEGKMKQIDTGYPVYNLPTKAQKSNEFNEYVRPLPPLSGPNPYEVLTSATLGKDYPGVPFNSLASMGSMQSTGAFQAVSQQAKPIKVVVSLTKG